MGAQVQTEDPEDVQSLTVTATSGTFTLSYEGPDSTGTVVTDTTSTTTPLNLGSTTLASDIQKALNALSNIGGVGGNVAVTEASYQTLTIPVGTTGTFDLSFTGPNSVDTTVTDITSQLSYSSATLAMDIENALDALANIGGVGGAVSVVQQSPGIFQITFEGSLTGSSVQLLALANNQVTSGGPVTIANTFSIAFGGTLVGEPLNQVQVTNPTFTSGTVASAIVQTGTNIGLANHLLLSGTGINNTGALQDVGGNNTWSGGITLRILPGFNPFTLQTGGVAVQRVHRRYADRIGDCRRGSSSAAGIPDGLIPTGLAQVVLGQSHYRTPIPTLETPRLVRGSWMCRTRPLWAD